MPSMAASYPAWKNRAPFPRIIPLGLVWDTQKPLIVHCGVNAPQWPQFAERIGRVGDSVPVSSLLRASRFQDEVGNPLSRQQHAPKDRPHPGTAEGGANRHARYP